MSWLHMRGELRGGLFALPDSVLPAFDAPEPVFPEPLTDATGLEGAAALLAEAVQVLGWAEAANQHPEAEPAGFGEAASQVRKLFEWVCPTSAAQLSEKRSADERVRRWLRHRARRSLS